MTAFSSVRAGFFCCLMVLGGVISCVAQSESPVAAPLQLELEAGDSMVGVPSYLRVSVINESNNHLMVDVDRELKSNWSFTYRPPNSASVYPLDLVGSGMMLGYVTDLAPHGVVENKYLLNSRVPLNVAGTYEIQAHSLLRDKGLGGMSDRDTVLMLAARNDSAVTVLTRELMESYVRAVTAGDKVTAIEALCSVKSDEASSELEEILTMTEQFDVNIFESFQKVQGETGLRALRKYASSKVKENRARLASRYLAEISQTIR